MGEARESATEAAMRAAQVAIKAVRHATSDEAGAFLSPPHDLLPNTCVKLAGGWVVFKRLDENGHLVVAKPGSACEWTYEPTDGELVLWAEPW